MKRCIYVGGGKHTVPSSRSTHHVGASVMRYSFDEPLEYVSSPMNLCQGKPVSVLLLYQPACHPAISPLSSPFPLHALPPSGDVLVLWIRLCDLATNKLLNLCPCTPISASHQSFILPSFTILHHPSPPPSTL